MPSVPVALYRAYIRDECEDYDASLEPSSADEEIPSGVYAPRWRREGGRDPDVIYNLNGEVVPGNGISTFDREGFFPSKKWSYFPIPEATTYDACLELIGPSFNDNYQANHYQFEPKYPLAPSAYLGALSNLARAALKTRWESARSSDRGKE
jgi:hypothetical protein